MKVNFNFAALIWLTFVSFFQANCFLSIIPKNNMCFISLFNINNTTCDLTSF